MAAPATRVPSCDNPQNAEQGPLRSGMVAGALLALILVIAAALRFAGPNWDSGHHQHPDERVIVTVTEALALPSGPLGFLDAGHSPLNPYNRGFHRFAYGTLPVFIVKALSLALHQTRFDEIERLGRAASASFDLGTVLLVFLIGLQVYGRRVALLAAAFAALTVLQIQLAHFYTVDSFLTFFTALTLLFAYRTWRQAHSRDAVILGLALGCAVATKISALLLTPIVIAACVLSAMEKDGRTRQSTWSLVALSLGTAYLAFRMGEPYAFLGPGPLGMFPNRQFVEDMRYWVMVSTGEIEAPFMVQWARTTPYLYPLRALVQWGMGTPLGVAALGGLAFAALELRHWRTSRWNLLLVAWSAIGLLYFGGQFAKFMRYLVPIYPALAVLAAYGLVRLWGGAGAIRAPAVIVPRLLAAALIAFVVGFSGWYAAAFTTLYLRPHSRVLASEWIYRNVPERATLAVEHWDDSLPLRVNGFTPNRYRYVILKLYDKESIRKAEQLADALDQADYVILASNRLAGSIPRAPTRYPLATAYYGWLFDGALGFSKERVFQQRPEFLGLGVDDTTAPEDLTVYEHPIVTIFKKRADYSSEKVRSLFARKAS